MAEPTSLSQTVTVASFRRYEDAGRVVARLADLRFPEGSTTIVGRDLRPVPAAPGRPGGSRAAAESAVAGGMVGGLLGLALALADLVAGGTVAVVLWGVLGGALVGLGAHAPTKGGEPSPRLALQATRFDVVADVAVAEDVARALHGRARAA